MSESAPAPMSRRELLTLIGRVAGTAAMYQAMTSLAFAADSTFTQPLDLQGAPKGASVLILGAGLAGMVAAFELRKAGYKVQILEYQNRSGGRNWSLYGGDEYTELGGFKQRVEFDKGLYLNAGPWRIPYHHRGILHYAKMLGVQMESFVEVNYAAYLHSAKAFGGKPKRFREIKADYEGSVAELLAKSVRQKNLDKAVSKEDREILLESLRAWGALDGEFRYVKGRSSSRRRGYDQPPGGGLNSTPTPSEPIGLSDILKSRMWGQLTDSSVFEDQPTLFQPVGGMGMIGRAFGKALEGVIQYNAKVTDIRQDDKGVTVSYVDTAQGGAKQTARADYCVCTIPATVLSQIPMNVGASLTNAIGNLPYLAAVKVGLQMKRRFWEEDEHIYGGITYTDQSIDRISYPSCDYFSSGKGVLLGAYMFGPVAIQYTAMSPAERVARAVKEGAKIHPQYEKEFENGVSVAWHRVPWILGCSALGWNEDNEAQYKDLCAMDGRIVLAGEHASKITAWQEGAVLSSLDAIGRLHKRAVQG